MQALRVHSLGNVAAPRASCICTLPKQLPRLSRYALRASTSNQQQQTNEAAPSTSTSNALPTHAFATTVAASTLLSAGNANAAAELMDVAAGDNRVSLLLTLFVPALAWVGFNILPALQRQLDTMAEKRGSSIVGPAVGLSAASLLLAQNADAATEVAQVADNRANLLFTLFVPALAWVGFNILPALQRQLDTMAEKRGSSIVGPAIGLGAASLLLAQNADAASEVAQVADNRVNLLFTLFIPALAWVGFNILPALQRQLDTMAEKRGSSIVGPAIGLGAGASLLLAQNADAATEVAQLADNRVNLLLTLFVPALAWVGFNIFPALLRQLETMSQKRQ